MKTEIEFPPVSLEAVSVLAAEKCLSAVDKFTDERAGRIRWRYSCDAIGTACGYYKGYFDSYQVPTGRQIAKQLFDKATAFASAAGCPCLQTTAFDEFEIGEERQSARYSWLMFLATLAREEGV